MNLGVLSPTTRRTIGVRGQLRLTRNNTLNFNLVYFTTDGKNQGTGGFNLAERAFNSSGRNWQAQLSELAIPNGKMVNEFRFQAIETDSDTNSVTQAIAVNVTGAFNSGGAQNDNLSRNRIYQIGDTLRWVLAPKLNLQVRSGDAIMRDGTVSLETTSSAPTRLQAWTTMLRGRPADVYAALPETRCSIRNSMISMRSLRRIGVR